MAHGSAAPAVMYFLYTCSAIVLTAITAHRLRRTPCAQRKLVGLRVGILILTVGTAFDNGRTFFGRFPGAFPVKNGANEAVSWLCVFTHEVLTAASFWVPLQLWSKAGVGARGQRRLAIAAHAVVPVLFIVGLVGFIWKSVAAPLVPGDACASVGSLAILKTQKDSPTGLVAVFVYSFGMIFAGVALCCHYGWRSRWLLFLGGNLACVVGQALMPALGDGYKCYASNFWEQVAFVLAVVADGALNGVGDAAADAGVDDVEGEYLTF